MAAPAFVEGLPQVTLLSDESKTKKIQNTCQSFCKWSKDGFPGSQPVPMDADNIAFLQQNLYKVTWKADGIRYMMLINGENEVYMVDRDNNVFHVPFLRFPHRKENRHIKGTLLDGELVFDKVVGDKTAPCYLIFDIVRFEEEQVGDWDFGKRLDCIKDEVIEPRLRAMKSDLIKKDLEPLSMLAQEFWDITQTRKLLSSDTVAALSYKIDGLIFQPIKNPYEPGRCDSVLKWKPHDLNSVDFKLVISKEHEEGALHKRTGYLYVKHSDSPFGQIRVTKDLMQYNQKIIECNLDNTGQWKFLRERFDKSKPNAYDTALRICKSIRNPVTKDALISFTLKRKLAIRIRAIFDKRTFLYSTAR